MYKICDSVQCAGLHRYRINHDAGEVTRYAYLLRVLRITSLNPYNLIQLSWLPVTTLALSSYTAEDSLKTEGNGSYVHFKSWSSAQKTTRRESIFESDVEFPPENCDDPRQTCRIPKKKNIISSFISKYCLGLGTCTKIASACLLEWMNQSAIVFQFALHCEDH